MNYPNEIIKCLYERASVRSFTNQEVTKETLRTIIDAGCHAATGGNLQPYTIIEIRSKEKKEALMATGCMQSIVRNAPVSLLFCIDWHRIEKWAKINHAPHVLLESYRHFWIAFQDTIIAAQNICTATDSLGLGSVYLGTVESCFDELRPMFNLPNGVFPVVIVSLGYPNKLPEIAPKLLYDEIVHHESYQTIDADTIDKMMTKKYGNKKSAPLTEKNLLKLYKASKEVHGEDYANASITYAKELGHIHPAQRYFGLHYVANEIRQGNKEFLDSIRLAGFDWINGTSY
ncbi:nitroreductase family protein [Clostridiaceae bacterium HSG29]|nr:nitroreductase family protein [Clostridiaceae bacterium HSG29]